MESGTTPRMQTERIKALSDAVLAIVLTILVLGFEVPRHEFGNEGLFPFFVKLAEPFVAYVVSFGIISTYWVQHTAMFHYMEFADRPLLWLNLLFLLPVSLLPFLTELRAVYHDEYIVTALYAGANIACGLLLLLLWRHATRRELTREVIPEVGRSMSRRILLGVAINVVGAAVAPIDIHLSSLVFLTLPVIYFSHRVVDSHWSDVAHDTATKT